MYILTETKKLYLKNKNNNIFIYLKIILFQVAITQ